MRPRTHIFGDEMRSFSENSVCLSFTLAHKCCIGTRSFDVCTIITLCTQYISLRSVLSPTVVMKTAKPAGGTALIRRGAALMLSHNRIYGDDFSKENLFSFRALLFSRVRRRRRTAYRFQTNDTPYSTVVRRSPCARACVYVCIVCVCVRVCAWVYVCECLYLCTCVRFDKNIQRQPRVR